MNQPVRSQVAPEILAAAAVLERGTESVRAVVAGEENRFTSALSDLQSLADKEGMPLAIVGGLGAIHFGYPAITQDIDVALGKEHLDKFLQVAPKYGFKVTWQADTGWHTLAHGDVEINIVPEGGKARKTAPTTIPGPPQLGVSQGLAYASLSGWLELKLSSARQKDRAHIVEVLKKASASAIQEARRHLATIHEDYAQLFDQLHQEAVQEKEQEGQRGH